MGKALLVTVLFVFWKEATFINFDVLGTTEDKELLFYDFRIKESDYFRSYNTTSFCKCRNACSVTPLCQTVSMNIDQKQRIDCRLSAYQIYSLTMDPYKGALTYAKAKRWSYWFGMDGLFYVVRSRLATLEEQRKQCRSYHSGRLLTLKSKTQLWSLRTFLTEHFWDGISFIVDLEEEGENNNLLWSDGTKFVDTDLVDLFDPVDIAASKENGVYMATLTGNEVFISKDKSNKSWNICQLNPFSSL